MRLVAKQIEAALGRHDVVPIESAGKPFDPNLHQAIQQVQTDEHPPMTVVQEVERGFTLKDRVVRPATVIVSTPVADGGDKSAGPSPIRPVKRSNRMPTYDYECKACHHRWELFQSIKAEPEKKCPKCGKRQAQRMIGPGAGIIFKGSGFYQTDYRSSAYKKAAEADKKASEGTSAKSNGEKSDSSSSKSESKVDPKSKSSSKSSGKKSSGSKEKS